MNLSYYPKPPLQLEPIKNVKIKQFGNRREARINDSQKIRNFESLKTSFMNYEQMNSPSHISSNKRPTTRTLASIRNKNLRLAPTGNNKCRYIFQIVLFPEGLVYLNYINPSVYFPKILIPISLPFSYQYETYPFIFLLSYLYVC